MNRSFASNQNGETVIDPQKFQLIIKDSVTRLVKFINLLDLTTFFFYFVTR